MASITRMATLAAAALVALTASVASAYADETPSGDPHLVPGATLAAPVITDLRTVTADIVTVSGTGDERREDTTGRTTIAIGAKVLFGKDSAKLTPTARARIWDVAREIRSRRATKATIAGYTDDLGSAAHGLTLSRQRAEAVRDALRQVLGANVTYIVQGFGESNPVSDNGTESGREKNRRVTITFPRQQ
ncbi:OmpA family protein [Streptomyces sp. NPDC054841]